MHKTLCLARTDPFGHGIGREHGRKGHHAACNRLANAHDVGFDPCVFPRKEFARTAKTRRNFVKDKQYARRIAGFSEGF